jgi:very-short-patch-repair endonuclease
VDDGEPAIRADFLWRRQRLIIETDGHATHQAFERDRRRDQRLAVAGYRVVRFTWRQISHEPTRVASALRRLLAQPASASSTTR